MKTINSTLFFRLLAQAEEAETQGMEKVAESLTTQIEKNASHVRESDENYKYSYETLEKDINDHLWNAVIRVADFYDVKQFHADKTQEMIEKIAKEIVSEVCLQANINHGVGAYEEPLPGELVNQVNLEVVEK